MLNKIRNMIHKFNFSKNNDVTISKYTLSVTVCMDFFEDEPLEVISTKTISAPPISDVESLLAALKNSIANVADDVMLDKTPYYIIVKYNMPPMCITNRIIDVFVPSMDVRAERFVKIWDKATSKIPNVVNMPEYYSTTRVIMVNE